MQQEAVTAGQVASGTFPIPEVGQRVDTLAGYPIRSILVLASLVDPSLRTQAERGQHLNKLQGDNIGLRFHADNYSVMTNGLRVLCEKHILQSAQKKGQRGKPARAFRANPELPPYTEEVAGVLLDWELQFPHLSLAKALGEGRSTTAIGISTASLRIYHHLLRSESGAAAAVDFADKTDRQRRSTEFILSTLAKNDMLLYESQAPAPNRKLVLSDPAPDYLESQGARVRALMRTVYTAVNSLRQKRRTEVSVAELAHEVALYDQRFTSDDVVNGLRVHTPPYIRFTDVERFGKGTTHSRYEISPDKKEALEDLVFRIESLADRQFCVQAVKRAYKILQTPEDIAFLLAKGQARRTDLSELSTSITVQTQNRRRVESLVRHRLPIIQGWRLRGACSKEDPQLFFPTNMGTVAIEEARKAKAVCRTCTEVPSCLQWALDTNQQLGVFGGMSRTDRRAYRTKPMLPSHNKLE